jgi:YVTN family beta-propeller protein
MLRRQILRLFTLIALVVLVLAFSYESFPSRQPTLAQETSRDEGLYRLPESRTPVYTSSSIASNSNNTYFVTANMLNGTISRIDRARQDTVTEIEVGRDPRSVAITPDDTRVLVVNRADGTLSVVDLQAMAVTGTVPVGLLPYGVVAPSDTTAWVTLEGTDEVVQIDLTAGEVVNRIAVPDAPTGLAAWGEYLYITHLWSGQLSLIYLPQNRLTITVDSPPDSALSQSIAIDPQRGTAYLPQSRLNSYNPALTVDSAVLPQISVFDLNTLTREPALQIALDTADQPVNMPFAAAVDVSRRWLYIANAGSNNVSVIDLVGGLQVASFAVKDNPRSLMLSANAGLAYIHNMIDGTVTIFDSTSLSVVDEIPVSSLRIPSDIYIGAQLFHSAADPRVTNSSWMSCASCHFNGASDGRVWQLPPMEGSPAEQRNTPSLYDLAGRTRFNWDGSWDELADVELKIRALQAGTGLIETGAINPPLGDPHSGLSAELDTLAAYLLTLEGPAGSPPQESERVERGQEIFAGAECASCHSIDTQDQLYDVGTDGDFRAPSLNWLWQSAPYLHDGRAETLLDVFILPGSHQLTASVSFDDIEALTIYLMSLPQAEPETSATAEAQ